MFTLTVHSTFSSFPSTPPPRLTVGRANQEAELLLGFECGRLSVSLHGWLSEGEQGLAYMEGTYEIFVLILNASHSIKHLNLKVK